MLASSHNHEGTHMRRRDFLPKTLFVSAAAAGGALTASGAQAQTQTCSQPLPCYPKTLAEGDYPVDTTVPSYEDCGESLPERFYVNNGSNIVTSMTQACQRAIDVAPAGGVVRFTHTYEITAALTINKALTLVGSGYPNPYDTTVDQNGNSMVPGYIKQKTPAANVFTLVPTNAGYAFNYPGIVGVRFQNLAICGLGDGDTRRCARGIGVVTSDERRHIRHVHITDCSFKHCKIAVDLEGIAYLNEFHNVLINSCGTGVRIAKGNAVDNGGQTRFFGCQFVMNTNACFDCTQTVGGDFAFFGCTMSHSEYGINAHEETVLTVTGCTFEDNRGAGIYIQIAPTGDPNTENPNTETTRTILGNKFLFNALDIHFHKTSQAFPTSGWRYPTLIDGNTFLGTLRFHTSADAGTIVIGAANGGRGPGGTLSDDQLDQFADTNLRALQSARPVYWRGTGSGNQVIAAYDVPNGATIHLLNLDRCTIHPTTGARSHAGCALLSSNNTTYENFFGFGFWRSGAKWKNTTGATQSVRLVVNDNNYGTIISFSAQVYIG